VSEGRLILMSTTAGRRGVFFETWEHGEGWLWIRHRLDRIEKLVSDIGRLVSNH
jgi:hypothetical protein